MLGKIHDLVHRAEEDAVLQDFTTGRDLVAVEAQDKALIEQYLSGKEIGKACKASEMELDLNAQIAGLLAGQRVEVNPKFSVGGEHPLQLNHA